MIALWAALALAAEPAPDPSAPPAEDVATEEPTSAEDVAVEEVPAAEERTEEVAAAVEITVWGEPAIRQARSAIVRRIESLGYRSVDKPGGRILFKPPRRWLGRVWLEDDGSLRFLRPVVAWKTAEGVEWSSVDGAPFERTPAGTAVPGGSAAAAGAAALWILPSQRLLEPERQRVRAATAAEREAYVDVVRETGFQERLADLPDRLDALWADGTPLVVGAPRLTSVDTKHAAILEFWASRADTREGDTMAAAAAAWLRGTLQGTDDAIRPEQAADAESRAPEGRVLDIF